jgi:hypothetical protein
VRNNASCLTKQWQVINCCEQLETISIKKLLRDQQFKTAFSAESKKLICCEYANEFLYFSESTKNISNLLTKAVKHDIFPQRIKDLGFIEPDFCLTKEKAQEIVSHAHQMEIVAGRDKNILMIRGFHHNYNLKMKDSEILKFRDFQELPNKFYSQKLYFITPLGNFISYKTFFPYEWTPEQVATFWINLFPQAEIIPSELKRLLKLSPKELLNVEKVTLEAHITENLFLRYIFNIQKQNFDTIHPFVR